MRVSTAELKTEFSCYVCRVQLSSCCNFFFVFFLFLFYMQPTIWISFYFYFYFFLNLFILIWNYNVYRYIAKHFMHVNPAKSTLSFYSLLCSWVKSVFLPSPSFLPSCLLAFISLWHMKLIYAKWWYFYVILIVRRKEFFFIFLL